MVILFLRLVSQVYNLEDAINYKDGETAGRLLSFSDPHIANRKLQIERPESQCERWFSQPWDEIIAAHLRCCFSVANHDFVDAYAYQSLVSQAFLKVLQTSKEENWMLPIMFAVSVDLRNFASSAEIQMTRRGKDKTGEHLEKAAEQLMAMFRVCASDNRAAPEDSKKWGMLNLVNQLFKIYFKINKLQLCKPLIRAIDSLPIKEKFAISQMITYRYYVGRKALFDSDFKSAEEYLTFAFQHCHKRSKKNKRMILIYLIPVKMLLGHMPKVELLGKYDLLQFADVTKAVSCGNLLKFNEALQLHQAFFIKCGIYLILEKLKIITYRNLFKKVSLIMGTHQLPVSAFTAVLQQMGEDDVDDDEVECILANLIYENKIKGYISRTHRKLVISKKDAFPPLSTVL